jgi:hypothetical protein
MDDNKTNKAMTRHDPEMGLIKKIDKFPSDMRRD